MIFWFPFGLFVLLAIGIATVAFPVALPLGCCAAVALPLWGSAFLFFARTRLARGADGAVTPGDRDEWLGALLVGFVALAVTLLGVAALLAPALRSAGAR